jgi:hypothetical protein
MSLRDLVKYNRAIVSKSDTGFHGTTETSVIATGSDCYFERLMNLAKNWNSTSDMWMCNATVPNCLPTLSFFGSHRNDTLYYDGEGNRTTLLMTLNPVFSTQCHISGYNVGGEAADFDKSKATYLFKHWTTC